MSAQWVPRRQLREHLLAGWHFFEGMDYGPAETAFFMWLGPRPTPKEVDAIMQQYEERDARVLSNRRQGGRCHRSYRKIAP